MHRITTMYDYVAGISDVTDKEKFVLEKTQTSETSNDEIKKMNIQSSEAEASNASQPEYMQMSGSNSSSGTDELDSPCKNLNYIKVETKPSAKSTIDLEVITNELKITEPSYYDSNDINIKSDQFSQECSNVLDNFSSDYMIQPSNIPVSSPLLPKKLNIPQPTNGFSDYMTHPSNIPVTTAASPSPSFSRQQTLEMGDYLIQPSNRKVKTFDDGNPDEPTHIQITPKMLKSNSLRRQGSDSSKLSVDDELLEIINDFKNNVFTIQEVEQLVASWKNRNDVQQSFKDKQDQLQKMRAEYDRIQNQMKEKLKRPTPLERMKRMFGRSKTIHQKESSSIPKVEVDECHNNLHQEENNNNNKSGHRPMSSLSLHSVSSSSSSGRLSTGSACSGASLGDSGTHSDHEDRRFSSSTCRIGHPGSLLENYMVPPTPRPIHTPVSTPTPNEEKERLVFPSHRPSSLNSPSEHYILFPSNIPVYPNSSADSNHHHHHQSSSSLHHDYINFSGLNTIVETPHEFSSAATHSSSIPVNDVCITLQPIKIPNKGNTFPKLTENLCSSFKSSNAANNNNLNENNCFDKENFGQKKIEFSKC